MAARNRLAISVSPNEVLFPGTSIVVESGAALDAQSAQAGVVLSDMRGHVKLSRSGRVATWTPEGALSPGHHLLEVGGLRGQKGRPIPDRMSIPCFVTDSVANVPRTLMVTGITRLRVNEMSVERLRSDRRPEGKYIEVMKAFNRKTQAPVALAFDQSGRPVEADRVFKRIAQARWKKFGKVHETLFERLHAARASTRIPVALWLHCDEASVLGGKKSTGETRRPPRQDSARDKAIKRTVAGFMSRVSGKYGDVAADPIAPVVYAELTRDQVQALAREPEVAGAFLHEREGTEDLIDSIAIANSDNVHALGFKGSGVKVAVWESGPDDATLLSISASYLLSGFATSAHARHTHGIVKNVQKSAPHGHAPSCQLHSANDMALLALAWAHGAGCTVISQSFHRPSEPGSSSMSFDDVYKDNLALRWPYPTIVQAAGNYWNGDPDGISPPASEYVNHKGFNSLAVGNHDDSATTMSGDSVFRNPASSHGDRELPEIAANGTSVTTVGLTMSGTSMASPAAAGCVALIQNVNPTLKSWPEGCRAILLAAARRNISNGTWWHDVSAGIDAVDGTGAVDALAGTTIAKRRRSRSAAATTAGWDVGTLTSRDVGRNGTTTFSYFVTAARGGLASRVKVALAWDAHITAIHILGLSLPIQSSLTVDLDLEIFDSNGVLVGYSGSWDNSYEIAEFVAYPGETYTIKIRRWSGSDDVWYGIAWSATGIFRNVAVHP